MSQICFWTKVAFMKKYLKNPIFVVLIAFALIQFSCDAQSKINGYVYDAQNKPIENAAVQLAVVGVGQENKELFQTAVKTNEDGAFSVYVGHGTFGTDLRLIVAKDEYKIFVLETTAKEIQQNKEEYKNYKIVLEKD